MNIEVLIAEVARAYVNPGDGEGDANGNTRLAILQERFGLSSLKLQKILVTAGVYEPVKSGTAYHTVKKLRDEGKSAEEIMKITGLSSATVSACIPYEKTLYNADKNGAALTSAAERKRRQRNREEEKRLNTLEMLQSQMSDEDFLNAVRDYEGIIFISLKHERYSVELRHAADVSTVAERKQLGELAVHTGEDKTLVFSEAEVLDAFHNGRELLSSGQEAVPASFKENESLPYIYPLLVVFGIIPGDRENYTVKRRPADLSVCACCGRRAGNRVKTYGDLVRISREIEKKEFRRWDPEGKIRAGSMDEAAGTKRWDEAAVKDNAAIRAFNREGDRMLCDLCAQTIFMALEDGDLPVSMDSGDDSLLTPEAVSAEFFRSMKEFPEGVCYEDGSGRIYRAGMLQEEPGCMVYLHEAKDRGGTVHTFACYMQDLSAGYRIFDAFEIHRLTKAGKKARDYTGTDYCFRTELKERCTEDRSEDRRRVYLGFLELTGKIREGLISSSLEWSESTYPISNNFSIGRGQCGLRSTGEMKIVCVDKTDVQGRQWSGGQYGFMIDGILFTGEEVSLMSSVYEGETLQYRFADSADSPLRAGEYLMPVRIGDRLLVQEMSELLNLFSSDGKFISNHDKENFGILFEKTVLKKLKLYHESNPRGYGRLAAMHLIKRLQWVEDTAEQEEQIRQIVRM